jgi:hypothetical protein
MRYDVWVVTFIIRRALPIIALRLIKSLGNAYLCPNLVEMRHAGVCDDDAQMP